MAKKPCTGSPVSMNREWETRDALSTLRRAEEIKNDKGLMRRVEVEAKKQIAAVSSVIGKGKK